MSKSSALLAATTVLALLACQYVECRHGGQSRRRHEYRRIDSDNEQNKHLRIRDKNSDMLPNSLRMRGANQTDSSNFPYMAAIFINDIYWCAGAIVDVNWVLTAAHCLNYVLHASPPSSVLRDVVKVRVGSAAAAEGGQLVRAVGAVRHPRFEEEPPPHADVALLKLEKDLQFNQFINLIKIYDGMKEPFAQSFITVTGWGATNGSESAWNEASPSMLTARLKVRSQDYCEDSYQLLEGFMFTEDFFCASLRNGTRDACLFDAGAPAVQNNRLLGIMSFGPERCEISQPPVFIKAFYFRDFVKSTISSYKTPADLMKAMAELQAEDKANEKNTEVPKEDTTRSQ